MYFLFMWILHNIQVNSNPLMSSFESPAQGLEMDGELGMDLSHHNYAEMLGMNDGEVNLQTNNNLLEHPDGNNVRTIPLKVKGVVLPTFVIPQGEGLESNLLARYLSKFKGQWPTCTSTVFFFGGS